MSEKKRDLIWENGQYPEDNLSTRTVFAFIGRSFARIFIHLPVTPNQITAFWGLLMIVSCLLMGTGQYWHCVIGAVLWVLCYGMDFTDGIIARIKGPKTKSGKFLDIMIHLTTYPLLMFCIGYGVYTTGGHTWLDVDWFKDEWFLFAGVVAGISMVLIESATDQYQQANGDDESIFQERIGATGIEGKLFKNQSLFKKVMEFNPLLFTNMMLIMVVMAALDQMGLFIVFYAVGYACAIFARFLIFYRDLNHPQ